ncbi:Translocation protein S62 [Imshaugia aleurites]|uniref:Translocation protein SEC62 n=1 Tax=Imshaugia aleurites TaxID=172621 RepID=A0A8H3I1W9_9LECA|nr:Translocation protein S62 [Imshaugia aleurites]
MSGPPAPGQQPSPQQLAAIQQQIAAEAQRRGMTPQQLQAQQRQQVQAEADKAGLTFDQYINKLKQQAFENHQRQQQMAQQQAQTLAAQPPGQPQMQGQQGQQVPITPGAPDPRALALAKWLRGQDLKPRTCILNGQRKDMFKVKRALRAIDSPAYTKARSKNPLLPEITAATPKAEIFKLLPLSLLALRVSKSDPHEGHGHAPSKPQKRIKGLWTVKIEQQQDINDDLHYVWLYEGPQWRTKLYAVGALILIMTVVMFPLWPIKLRIGVWYLSMGFLGLIGLFFAMAIVRLILFCVTVFTVPPGLWLYPNLFEDVGFFDSFRPIWGWQEDKKAKKVKKSKKGESKEKSDAKSIEPSPSTHSGGTTNGQVSKRHAHAAPRVEEVEDK